MRQIILTYNCNRNCEYCFAKGLIKKWPDEISLQNLETIFKWFSKQNIRNGIGFNGGEPTLFSKINLALELAQKYKLKIIFYTNGIFDSEDFNFRSKAIDYFLFNFNPISEYSDQERKLLYFNLQLIRRSTKRIGLRFNIVSPDVSYKYIIDICKKINISYVEFACVFPSISKKNKYIKKEKLKNFSKYVSELTKNLLKNNIRCQIAEPLPLCIFSKRERDFLIKNAKLNGVCGAGKNYMITPDLTIFPCVGLITNGSNLKNFKNEKEVINYYQQFVDKLKWEVDLFPECKNCLLKKNKQCQGACLSYKHFRTEKILE